MHTLDVRLAEWLGIYKELNETQQKLKLVKTAREAGPDSALQAAAGRLQAASDAALAAIQKILQSEREGAGPQKSLILAI